ncbi:MAG: hypothetical protein GF399_07600 [Candidatus Coatesbacteria bacterium]|nr:hypothetical protein [Candidatus Coatesbacteria bacterium]
MKKAMLISLAAVLTALLAAGCDGDVELDPYWVAVELPGGPAAGLRDLDAAGDVVCVVGLGGEFWRRAGGSWSELDGPSSAELTGVAVRSDGGAWACGHVGDAGRLYDYAPGAGWSEVTPADCAYLNEVAVNADDTACAVGSAGQVWRLVADVWERLTVPADYLWRSVDVGDDGTLLVVGADAAGTGTALLIEGDDSSYHSTGGDRLEDCTLTADGAGWLVAADGVVYRFDAAGAEAVVDTERTLFGVAADPAGGGCWICGPGAYLARVDAAGGLSESEHPAAENLQDLIFIETDEGWAAAETHLLHYR